MLKAALRFTSLFLAAATLLVAVGLSAPAGAQEIGTRAFTNYPLALHDAPGSNTTVLGQVPGDSGALSQWDRHGSLTLSRLSVAPPAG